MMDVMAEWNMYLIDCKTHKEIYKNINPSDCIIK